MINKLFVGYLSLLITALSFGPAAAWSHGNRWGGSSSHSYGSTSHASRWAPARRTPPERALPIPMCYGGSATRSHGRGVVEDRRLRWDGLRQCPLRRCLLPSARCLLPGISSADHGELLWAGCYNCGGWSTAGAAAAGAAVGMVAGAAIASANTSAATSSAYSAGVAAGAAAASAAPTTYVMGAIYAKLPAGCVTPSVQSKTYYLCGNTWFQPSYGANGVYYTVVPTP